MKVNKILLFSGIISILIFSIPNSYSITFDEDKCLSLISADHVKEITGFEGMIESRIINGDLASLNDDLISGCMSGFENEDGSFSLGVIATVAKTADATKEKFDESLIMAESLDIPVELISNNGWEYFVVDIKHSGLNSILVSMKGEMLVGINAPDTWHVVDSASLLEMAKVIHANIDDVPYEINQVTKSKTDVQNQVTLEKISSIEIFDERTCLSFISKNQAENIIENKHPLKITAIRTPSQSLHVWGDGATDACGIFIKNEDRSFEIIASIIEYETSRIAQDDYDDNLLAGENTEWNFSKGENNNWNYNLSEINFSGIGSGYNSIKDNLQLKINVQPSDPPIDAQITLGFANVIQTSIDKLQNSEDIVLTTTDTSSGDEDGGGCLIATATYGTELAPQVQQLRELRDNKLLQTESGKRFVNLFNHAYYSFSPIIADYERENPIFKEMVKFTISPMINSLSVLNHVDMDSEAKVLGYGISLIALNLAMYVGIPIFAIIEIRKKI